MSTYLYIDDDVRYRACELVDGRRTIDLPVGPFETARDALRFVAGDVPTLDWEPVFSSERAEADGEHGGESAPSSSEHGDAQSCPFPPPPEREERATLHEHTFVRYARFSDLVAADGTAARAWWECVSCPERREIVP